MPPESTLEQPQRKHSGPVVRPRPGRSPLPSVVSLRCDPGRRWPRGGPRDTPADRSGGRRPHLGLIAVLVRTDGLTAAQVSAARAEHGTNSIPSAKRPGVVRRAGRQAGEPDAAAPDGSCVPDHRRGDHADTAVILAVVVLNTAVGVTQKLRAEREVAALRDLSAPHARVRRDGQDRLVDATDVVAGDLLLVDAGDVVAADAQVVEAQHLETDDSALTGESLAVGKAPATSCSRNNRREGTSSRGGDPHRRGELTRPDRRAGRRVSSGPDAPSDEAGTAGPHPDTGCSGSSHAGAGLGAFPRTCSQRAGRDSDQPGGRGSP